MRGEEILKKIRNLINVTETSSQVSTCKIGIINMRLILIILVVILVVILVQFNIHLKVNSTMESDAFHLGLKHTTPVYMNFIPLD